MATLDGNTTVLDLLTNHPQVFDVLAARGMCESCKADPPPVPLHHFADKHCDGNLSDLLEALKAAITTVRLQKCVPVSVCHGHAPLARESTRA